MKNTPNPNITASLQSANNYFNAQNWQAAAKEYDQIGQEYQAGANPDYEKALTYLQKALDCKRKFSPNETPDIADSYYRIASNHSIKGEYDKALPYFQKSLNIYQQHYGEQHEEVAAVYHSLGILYRSTAAYSLALKYLEQALQIMIDLKGESYLRLYGYYFVLGTIHYMMGTFEQALKYMLKAQSFFETNEIDDIPYLANIHSLLGGLYEIKGEYDLGIQHSEKSLYYLGKSVSETHPQFGFYYHNMACIFISKGETSAAMGYLQKALKIMSESLGEKHYEVGTCLNTIGACYLDMGKYSQALQYFQKSLQNRQHNFGEIHDFTAGNYSLIGQLFQAQGDFPNAIAQLQKALHIYLQVLPKTHPEIIGTYNRMAVCNGSLGDFSKTFDCLQKNCLALTKTQPKSLYEITILPQFSNQPENLQMGLDTLETKAEALFLQFNSLTSKEKDSSLLLLMAALVHYQVCSLFINQLRQQYKANESKLTLSQKAFKVYQKAIEVALSAAKYAETKPTHFKNTLQELTAINPDSELQNFLQSLQKEQACEKLAFRFAENCKGILLLEGFQNSEAKATAQIPADLLQEEKTLLAEITYLEKRIGSLQSEMQQDENKNEAELQPILRELQSQTFDARQAYLQLIEKLEREYPDYFQLKYESQTIEVADLQNGLSEQQVLVSYFVGEKNYYLFVVVKDEFEVQVLTKPNDFEASIKQFLQAIEEHDQAAFIQKGHELYQWLIQPIADFLFDPLGFEDELKHLTIIPHAELNYLPFEALVCELPFGEEPLTKPVPKSRGHEAVVKACPDTSEVYQNLDYLLNHCQISYQYSATLWHYLKNRKNGAADSTNKTHSTDFVGFAPIYTTANETQKQVAENYQSWATRSEALRSDGTWVSLPHSKTEAENIAALFEAQDMDTQIFLHESANKANFVKAVGKSRFVLIASHGMVNDLQPKLSGLVFYPESKRQEEGGKKQDVPSKTSVPTSRFLLPTSNSDCILSMEETYQLQLQADLVVLSSCESGIGALTKGEGMMAVNRGFLYAGAKNVVFTLFKVLDKTSSELTQSFFARILKGDDFVTALRKAKLALIEQEGIDPKSWSGFVLLGN